VRRGGLLRPGPLALVIVLSVWGLLQLPASAHSALSHQDLGGSAVLVGSTGALGLG